MKTLLFFIALLTPCVHCFSQTGDIQMIKKLGGVRFMSDGRNLKQKQVLEIMESDPQAYEMFKRARTNYGAASVLGFVGGFLIGYPVGAGFAGARPNWGLAAGGLGLVLIGIPFTSAGNQQASEAIGIYNGKATARNGVRVSFSLCGTGAKLSMKL